MRINEIQSLKLSDVTQEVIDKHFGEARSFALKAESNNPELSEDENFYARIMFDLNEGESEPTLGELISALELVKGDLIEARVAERMATVDEAFLQRWGYEEGMIYNQIVPFVKTKVLEEDDTFFDELNAKIALYANEADTNQKILHGELVEQICKRTLNFITGMNASKGLTGEQIDTIQSTYEEAETWLRKQRPAKVLGIITAIVPDGILVTEDDKAEIIAFLTNELQAVA